MTCRNIVGESCQNIICVQQRESVKKAGIIRKGTSYDHYNKCASCKTRWEKDNFRCPCCGYVLRRSCRKKTPYIPKALF